MNVDKILTAIAGFGLVGTRLIVEVDVATWEVLRHRLVLDRLTGVAAEAAQVKALVAGRDSLADLAALDRKWIEYTLRAEDALLEAVGVLRVAGIPTRVLKGPALAERAWRAGHTRRWVDADVLVPSECLADAVAVLINHGAVRQVPELRRGFDRRFAKAVTLRSHGGQGAEVDLHRSLVLGPHTFIIDEADLWAEPQAFEVEGVRLETLSPEATLLHACMHATITGRDRLGSLRDVFEAHRRADLAVVADLAARWKATPSIVAAGHALGERLGLDDHPFVRWTASLTPTTDEMTLHAVYRPGNRTARNLARASLPYIAGARAKASFLLALGFPDRKNRAGRGRTVVDQLRAMLGRSR